MIAIVCGKIGSGKTYWGVNYLVEKHYEFKTEILDWVSKTGVRIVTNIRNLVFPHVDLDREIQEKGLRGVFSHEYTDHGRIPTIFLIDEAQAPDKFHRKFYDPEVALFFQTSRHSGTDIILITQDTGSLAKEIKLLAEYEIVAKQRTKRFRNSFVYDYKIDGEAFKRQVIKFKQNVANVYQSFMAEETERPRSMIWKYIIIVAVMATISIGGFFAAVKYITGGFSSKSAPAKAASEVRDGAKAEQGRNTPEEAVSGELPYVPSPAEKESDRPGRLEGVQGENVSNITEKRGSGIYDKDGESDTFSRRGNWVEKDFRKRQEDRAAREGSLIRDNAGNVTGSYVIYE